MTVKELIESLQKRDPSTQVEAIVVAKTGEIFVMVIEAKTKDMVKALKLFKQ